jgi:phosphatidylethanolamine-binding protein (PEBP) family uncharacterized protein
MRPPPVPPATGLALLAAATVLARTVYALDVELNGHAGMSASAVESEIRGHVRAEASIIVATPPGDTTTGT